MSKKTTNKASSAPAQQNPVRAILSTLITGILIVFGAIFFNATGIDILGGTTVTSVAPGSTSTNTAPVTRVAGGTGAFERVSFEQGRGARQGFWQVYFTEPTGSRDRSTYNNGIDQALASAIDQVRSTLDIAAFEFNNPAITEAVLRAHERGVTVRVVTDDEFGTEDDDATLVDLELVGIPIVDDARSGLMHNKFMILDSLTVWTGSTNFTVNGIYRNNNNMLAIRSVRAVQAFQSEFDEMFIGRSFGTTSPQGNSAAFVQDGSPIEIYFASEDDVIGPIIRAVGAARSQIRFMTFSFTENTLGDAMLARHEQGLSVEGVFETTGSGTEFSNMNRMFCAGVPVFRDGNSFAMHHKVIIIDDDTVITGSFNFSNNAVSRNDENLIIIRNRDIASLYLEEYARIRNAAAPPPNVSC